ncbi:MAG: FkbM family methyltransferase [Chitinophagales bacterium]|nr:FkbM family methyltransferase [Bacteroidota bacterium]
MRQLIKSILGERLVNWANSVKSNYLAKQIPIDSVETIAKRKQFYSQFVQSNNLVFDVGANYGNRTQPLLNIGAKVVAIEPQKACYEYLQKNFGNTIELVTFGLGAEEDIKDFYVSNASTISSFSKDWIDAVKQDRFKSYTWSEPIKIKITTLDKLIEKFGVPQFIKIDVEGYELEVLKGLTKPINYISIEYTVPEQTQRAIDCIKQIEKYNQNIECNYSKDESMQFALENWQSVTAYIQHVNSEEFIATGFGDIYIRSIQ